MKDTLVTFWVHGVPAPQGSKRAYVNKATGRANLVESSKKVGPWREAVAAAANDQGVRLSGPVSVSLVFYMTRPAGHYGTGRNARRLRHGTPIWPTSRSHGDLDKLVRSTLDGLVNGGLITDDSDVVNLHATKVYGTESDHTPGAHITVQLQARP